MALNIKDKETEALVNEIAALTGETKTGAVRRAAQERLERLRLQKPRREMTVDEIEEWFEDEIWSKLPSDVLGRPITKAEREEILGYGPGGV